MQLDKPRGSIAATAYRLAQRSYSETTLGIGAYSV
jgi:hypothetical protein